MELNRWLCPPPTTFRLDLAIYSDMQVSNRDLVQDAFLLCSSVLLAFFYAFLFFYFLFFSLMVAGTCFAQPICNSWSSWHLPCLVQRWHSPLQRPLSLRPIWQTARCHRTQRACRWWHKCSTRVGRRPRFTSFMHFLFLIFLAGSTVLMLTCNICTVFSQHQRV